MTWWISYVRVMLIKAMHCSMKYPKVMTVKTKRISGSRRSSSLNSFWLAAARSLGNTDAEKKLYEWNASALITVWGDSIASNQGGLHDYSHREWSGLLKDLYYLRWKTFFEQKQQELEGKASGEVINFYGMEKAWAEKAHEY